MLSAQIILQKETCVYVCGQIIKTKDLNVNGKGTKIRKANPSISGFKSSYTSPAILISSANEPLIQEGVCLI